MVFTTTPELYTLNYSCIISKSRIMCRFFTFRMRENGRIYVCVFSGMIIKEFLTFLPQYIVYVSLWRFFRKCQ